MIKLGIILTVVMATAGIAQAEATRVSKYTIQPEGLVRADCRDNGRTRKSRIKLYQFKDAEIEKGLAPIYIKLGVCARFVGYIKDALFAYVPAKVLEPSFSVASVSRDEVIRVPQSMITEDFDERAPDRIRVKKINSQTIELIYTKNGEVTLGPMRLIYSSRAQNAPGFLQGVDTPVYKIEYDVRERNIVLKSKLKSVGDEEL